MPPHPPNMVGWFLLVLDSESKLFNCTRDRRRLWRSRITSEDHMRLSQLYQEPEVWFRGKRGEKEWQDVSFA